MKTPRLRLLDFEKADAAYGSHLAGEKNVIEVIE